jgi:hypothetical protein
MSIKWPLPEKFFVEHFNGTTMICHHGESKKWLDLEKPRMREWIFKSFKRVRSIDAAIGWCAFVGCPFGSADPKMRDSGVNILDPLVAYQAEHVLALAETVRWVWFFYCLVAHQQEPQLRKLLRTESNFARAISFLTPEDMALAMHVRRTSGKG